MPKSTPPTGDTPTPQTFANVPLPAGAVEVVDWRDDARYFKGSSWVIQRNYRHQDIHVYIDGLQRLDGPRRTAPVRIRS
jgi:hypothetical protein